MRNIKTGKEKRERFRRAGSRPMRAIKRGESARERGVRMEAARQPTIYG
jgi:hypothetical protein